MFKNIVGFSIVLLVSCLLLHAQPVPTVYDRWIADPLGWTFSEKTVESLYGRSFALVRDMPCSTKVEISADIVPVSAAEDQWATAGVSVYFDKDNFWHVALVRAPDDKGGGRFFELQQSYDGEWAKGYEATMKLEKQHYGAPWAFGKKYNLRIAVDEKGIEGEIRDAAGKIVFFKRYAFVPSKPGLEMKAVRTGAPALRTTGSFKAKYSSVKASSMGKVYVKPRDPIVPYSSDSFVADVKREAKGFFYLDKDADGRWWVIDPLGRGIVLTGVDHVKYQGHWSARTKRSVHHEVNKKKFPDKRDWETDTLNRLKKWGFNMLGAGCDSKLFRRGLVHTIFLRTGDALCWNAKDDSTWICPNEKRPCSAFPNVFHPKFAEFCDYQARLRCEEHRDDPWLLGYFIDNELAWWGRGKLATGLFDEVMKKDESHTAKIALRKFLKERGVEGEAPDEVKLDFLRLVAELYFKHTSEAIRKYDPNHLVMGSRFAGVWGAHDAVWEIAGKYCDLVTFNMYPWADIDRNVMYLGRNRNSKTVVEAFKERYDCVKKPMLITEWSFPALDSGLPCLAGAGQRFMFQKDRTKATELFAKTMLSTPFILGYAYFMWVDEPEEGISDEFPEDSNYGLINLQGEAYPGITSMFTEMQSDLGRWRRAPLPVAKTPQPREETTMKGFMKKFGAGAPSSVVCVRKGGAYEIRNKCGFTLKGNMGGRRMFHSVIVDGKDIGAYNLMLCHIVKDRTWVEPSKVKAFSFREENGYGIIDATSEYNAGERAFVIDHEIIVFPDSPRMMCNVKRIVNTGKKELNLNSFYFRQYAKFKITKEKIKQVPNLWRAPDKAVWLSADDTSYWGCMSFSPAANNFYYYLNKNGGQYPDAYFEIASTDPAEKKSVPLKPGETYDPAGRFWMFATGGHDGAEGWNKNVNSLLIDSTR